MATKPPKPIRIAGDQAPNRSASSVVAPLINLGEVVALWQLTRLAEARWLQALAWVLLVFAVLAAVARPWATRQVFVMSMARWRALRRIQRIEPADFASQFNGSPQEFVAFNVGVLTVTGRIGAVIAEEERRAGADSKDGVA